MFHALSFWIRAPSPALMCNPKTSRFKLEFAAACTVAAAGAAPATDEVGRDARCAISADAVAMITTPSTVVIRFIGLNGEWCADTLTNASADPQCKVQRRPATKPAVLLTDEAGITRRCMQELNPSSPSPACGGYFPTSGEAELNPSSPSPACGGGLPPTGGAELNPSPPPPACGGYFPTSGEAELNPSSPSPACGGYFPTSGEAELNPSSPSPPVGGGLPPTWG